MIDPLTATIYVVAATKEVVGSTTTYFEKVHALDIASGTEKLGGPITIQASVTGTGDGAVGGRLSLDPRRQGQRPALLLSNGVVYIAFGGHDDYPPYHGWILGLP